MNSWKFWSGNNIFSSDAAIIRFSGSYTRQNGPNEPLNQEDMIHEDFEYEIWPSGHRRRPHPVRHGVHELGAFAAEPSAETAADEAVVAGYLPPQDESTMTQGDIALHSSDAQTTAERDPNYGGYAAPVEDPIQATS